MPSSDVDQPLLALAHESTDHARQMGCFEWYRASRIAIAGLSGAILVVLYFSQPLPEAPFRITNAEGINLTSCFQVTSGSCYVMPCRAWRHSTCSWGACVCRDGCAGADDACYIAQRNEVKARDLMITNMRWPDQHVYVPSAFYENQLRTSTSPGSLFNLLQLPDGSMILVTASQKVIASVANFGMGARDSLHWRYDVRAKPVWREEQSHFLHYAALDLCHPRLHENALVFRFLATGTVMTMRHSSWMVYGYASGYAHPTKLPQDPGPEGYWSSHPNLPFKVKECDF